MRSHIVIEEHWGELRDLLATRIEGAVLQGCEQTRQQIQGRETRYGTADPGRAISPGVHLRDSFQVAPPIRYPGEIVGVVYTPDRNAVFQELGTRGNRKRKLKRQTSSSTGTGGVTPLYFARNAARDSFPLFAAAVEKAVRL